MSEVIILLAMECQQILLCAMKTNLSRTNTFIGVLFNEQLIIEQVVLTREYRKTDSFDFPENLAAAVDR
jgi:hypothetical protein